jgi:hypothetical protein
LGRRPTTINILKAMEENAIFFKNPSKILKNREMKSNAVIL